MRKFKSGATRDISTGKVNFYGSRHPLVELSFAKYMHDHNTGDRDETNWHKGWDKEISLQSMIRHTEDLQAIYAGYFVYEKRSNEGVEKIYSKKEIKDKDYKKIETEDTLNAIKFNVNAYLLQELSPTN